MYGDTGTTAHGGFGGVFLQRSSPNNAAHWPHGTKVLLWASLAAAGWSAVILAGYFVWSAV